MEYSSDAKNKILQAAADVFAEHGYRHGTIRQIAGKADMNVAAVNYYFGNKEALYQEVLKIWTETSFRKYPVTQNSGQETRPEEKLRYQIHQILSKLFDQEETPWFGTLFVRMTTLETRDQMKVLADRIYKPSVDLLTDILREIIGRETDEDLLYFMATDIIGQCVFYYSNRELLELVLPEGGKEIMTVEYLSRRITGFSLSAVRNMPLDGDAL